jgi:hypothetical protein
MAWIRLATLVVVFVTSCVGLGYLTECWVIKHKWRGWVTVSMAIGIALLWPVIMLLDFMYESRQHLLQYPNDDAPGMVAMGLINVVIPFLFLFGISLALCGAAIARRRHSNGEHYND